MQKLRYLHRWVTLFLSALILFVAITGTIVQLTDLRSILTHAPATDVNVQAMRESFDGPGFYAVRQVSDYAAAPLPRAFPYQAALPMLISSTRATVGNEPLRYLEFRTDGGRPIARAGVRQGYLTFDPASGRLLGRAVSEARDLESPPSFRNTFKGLHRFTTFGLFGPILNAFVPIGLATLIVTGLWIYFKMLFARQKIRSSGAFWKGGGTWRMLHRWTAIVAAIPLLAVTLSGTWLAVESICLPIFFMTHLDQIKELRPGPDAPPKPENMLQPGHDTQFPKMLNVVLQSAARDVPNDSIRVVRLRRYAGYTQGIVITGGENSQQLVYNAFSGAAMSETEPGFPPTGFPFGWQAHQTAKAIHRGSYFGMPGRWLDLISGFALIYFCISGIQMYWTMWRRRRQAGKPKILWH